MAYLKRRTGSRGVYWDARWDVKVAGKRKERSKTFASQKEAKQFLTTIGVRKPGACDPFTTLADDYLAVMQSAVAAKQRENSYLRQLRSHLKHHILRDSEFSILKCDEIDTPEVQRFLDRLYLRVSPAMASKVRTTLTQIFNFGIPRGYVTTNPVTGSKLAITKRHKLDEDGGSFVLPPKDDLEALLDRAITFDNTGRASATVRVLMFGGLRMSEYRGFPTEGFITTNGDQAKLSIRQRADEDNDIGSVKSMGSRRFVPIGSETVVAIKRWLEAAPQSRLVFPNTEGNVWSYSNFINRFWIPLMNYAGLVTEKDASKAVREWSRKQSSFKEPRFTPHMLRHVYASLQIAQGIQPKHLQELMGHSSLKVTMDRYGHLWPNEEADKKAAEVEKVFGGANRAA